MLQSLSQLPKNIEATPRRVQNITVALGEQRVTVSLGKQTIKVALAVMSSRSKPNNV
jgi:hypothetical protein